MLVTGLTATDVSAGSRNRGVLAHLYSVEQESVTYEFLAELNDILGPSLTEGELGRIFVAVNSNGECEFTNGNRKIYVRRFQEEF